MIINLLERTESDPPPFHHEVLCRYDDWKIDKYFIDQCETINATDVDVSRVIGHDQGYAEMTWAYMLRNLKRVGSNLREVAQNSDYYLNDDVKCDWSFIDLDGKLFISTGKHRATVLRYLAHYNPEYFEEGPIARGVQLYKRHLDYETIELVNAISAKVQAFPHLSFTCVNDHMGKKRWQLLDQIWDSGWLLTRGDLDELYDDLSRPSFLKRLLGRSYQAWFRRGM